MSNETTSPYAVVELRELDDDAAAGGLGESLEARFARRALGAERIGISLQRVKPGVRAPTAHRHEVDEEVYVVVAGSGHALVAGDVIELRPWTTLRVAPGTARAFEAGPEGLEFLAFGTHTETDRGEFVEADWPS